MVAKDDINHLQTIVEEVKHLYLSQERPVELSEVESEEIVSVVNQLKLMQVEDTIINELIAHLLKVELDSKSDKNNSVILSEAVNWCLKRIKIAPKLMSQHAKEVHCFIGPTGAGKTSMLAKLASHYQKYNTLIVSMDDKKVAASDQMRVYAKLLNIDFKVFSNAKSLNDFLKKSNSYELVLVDLPGTNLKNKSSVSKLSAVTESPNIFSHLVLPITERKIQLENNVRHYTQLGINSLVFTKLDESWKYGDIFNLSYRWGIPVSYFSCGRSIPEDIERSTKNESLKEYFLFRY